MRLRFRRTAYQELVETLAKRNSAVEELKKVELRRLLIVLSAPADSIVLEVANRYAVVRCDPGRQSRAVICAFHDAI